MSTIKRFEAYNNENNKIRAALYKELVKGPVKYQWEIVIKPHFSATIMAIVIALLMGAFLIHTGMDIDSNGMVFNGVVIVPVWYYISRYLLTPDILTKYKIMPLGISYTEKDCIPESVFTIIRRIALVGVVICLLAVFIVGPMAFVGAGGAALMSFQLINIKSVERSHEIYFVGECEVITVTGGGAIKFLSSDMNAYGKLFFQKKHTKRINKLLKQYVNITQIIELDSLAKVHNYN